MNMLLLSTQSLFDLHQLIAEALTADDAVPAGKKQYGVREYPDWRKQADAYEQEMKTRGMRFTPIEWSK